MAAGWHLRRNKPLLLLGAALLISLTLLIHHHFTSSTIHSYSYSCLSSIHDALLWSRTTKSWSWATTPQCPFRTHLHAAPLLSSAWIVVAGDSQARLFTLSLISFLLHNRTLMDEAVRPALFKRHSDYHLALPSNAAQIDFIWAPYPSNLTSFLASLRSRPHLLILTSGLWHMLRRADPADYARSLRHLRDALTPLSVELQPPRMFWMGMPTLVNSMLNTQEKRRVMTPAMWAAYDREVVRTPLLLAQGGPLFLLDMALLSRGCGVGCTTDGMHYDEVVYDAALHIMLNALLIQ